jgi:hypothetical protein
MEIHNTHAPVLNPDKRYAVTFTLTSGQILSTVLRGEVINAIRKEFSYAPHDRDSSIFWESEDWHFLPMPSIVHMQVSKTNINCNPNTISYVDGP